MKNAKKARYDGLEDRINDYFLLCDGVNEEHADMVKPYTLSGLLCHIGISRQELEKLCASRKYGKVMQNAKTKIEAFIEENALTGELSCNASANSLKYNFGWGENKDKGEIGSPKHITVTLSPEMSELAR